MKKAKHSDWREKEIVSLNKRLTKLEQAMVGISSATVLKLKPKDILIVQSEEPVPDYKQQEIANEFGRIVGFSVGILFARKSDVKVLRGDDK